jgi:hypothetical protein
MAITRHIYSKDGEHVYYRVENNTYEPGGARADTCWLSLEGGAEHRDRGNRIYSKDGEFLFYYAE